MARALCTLFLSTATAHAHVHIHRASPAIAPPVLNIHGASHAKLSAPAPHDAHDGLVLPPTKTLESEEARITVIGAGVNVALSASKAVVGAACGSRVLVADAAEDSELVVLDVNLQERDVAQAALAQHGGERPHVDGVPARLVEGVMDAGCAHLWSGMRTFTSDDDFLIGPDPDVEGLYWAAALGGHGVTCSKGVGRLAAAHLLGDEPTDDTASALDPRRFLVTQTS